MFSTELYFSLPDLWVFIVLFSVLWDFVHYIKVQSEARNRKGELNKQSFIIMKTWSSFPSLTISAQVVIQNAPERYNWWKNVSSTFFFFFFHACNPMSFHRWEWWIIINTTQHFDVSSCTWKTGLRPPELISLEILNKYKKWFCFALGRPQKWKCQYVEDNTSI